MNLFSDSYGWMLLKRKNKREQNKNFFYSYCTFNKILRQVIFHPGMKYLYKKYCSGYSGILPWTSEIPPSWGRIENVLVSFKRNNKFMKKCFILLFIALSRLVSHPCSHINSPLDGNLKHLFQRLIHLKDSDNLKQ